MERRTRILIVDDHLPTQKTLAAALKTGPHQLFFASSGEEVLKMAPELAPDLILLDISTPDIEGYQVCQSLRADPDLREVCIIVTTVLEDREAKLKALEAGADDFINKPIDPIELRARVNNIVRLDHGRKLFHDRKKYEQLVELSPDGVMLVKPDGVINLVNAALADNLHLPEREAIVGQTVFDYVQADDTRALLDYFRNVLTNGKQVGLAAITMRRHDGGTFPAEIKAARFRQADQTMVQMIVRDVSDRAKAEMEMESVQGEQAEELSPRKDEIRSNISHELRTPLSIISLISNNLDILYHELDEQKRLEMIREIRSQSRMLDGLIEGVLKLARLDSGRVETERRQINLMEVIRQEVDNLSRLAESKKLDVDVFGPERVMIWANQKQIRQVVQNLVQNALKATPQYGNIAIDCVQSTEQQVVIGWPGFENLESREWACFRVVDSGTGIAREELPYVFDRFYRPEGQGDISGPGLGLAIAKDYVQYHGGHIAVESQVEVGSNFAVYLPLDLRRRSMLR